MENLDEINLEKIEIDYFFPDESVNKGKEIWNQSFPLCIKILKNGNIAIGLSESFIILNNQFKIVYSITKIKMGVTWIEQLENENLILTEDKMTVILKEKDAYSYKIIQKIDNKVRLNKSIVLNNLKDILTVDSDGNIKLYKEENEKYEKKLELKDNNSIMDAIQIDNNIIAVYSLGNYEINFWDINEKNKKGSIKEIETEYSRDVIKKYKDKFLLVFGSVYIYIIDIIKFELIKKIKLEDKYCAITCIHNYKTNYYLAGCFGNFINFNFDEQNINIKVTSNKDDCHGKDILTFINILNNGNIISGSEDGKVKIWKI